MTLKRIKLIEAEGIQSSYTKSRKRLDISEFNNKGQRGNYICEDMFKALKELKELVKDRGGNLYLIDLFRSWDVQDEARKSYESGGKKAFVAKAGESFHGAGRAVDISIKDLKFEDVEKKDWLKVLWELARPLGFEPIIDEPDMNKSECWHFDFPGSDWIDVYDTLSYSEAVKCATLDVGEWDSSIDSTVEACMFIQSQLIRLGYYEIGKVDGIIGPKTKKVLDTFGLHRMSRNFQAGRLARKSRVSD